MKKYILLTCMVLVVGGYYYFFEQGNTTEYVIPDPIAYIQGATPTDTKIWEMY